MPTGLLLARCLRVVGVLLVFQFDLSIIQELTARVSSTRVFPVTVSHGASKALPVVQKVA